MKKTFQMNLLEKYFSEINGQKEINKFLLWDFGNIKPDYIKHKVLIIKRVVEYGTIHDWNVIFYLYKEAEIIAVIKQFSNLSPLNFNFVCKLFNLNKSDFKCYTKAQWRKAHWS